MNRSKKINPLTGWDVYAGGVAPSMCRMRCRRGGARRRRNRRDGKRRNIIVKKIVGGSGG
jgi:hypothetical protein